MKYTDRMNLRFILPYFSVFSIFGFLMVPIADITVVFAPVEDTVVDTTMGFVMEVVMMATCGLPRRDIDGLGAGASHLDFLFLSSSAEKRRKKRGWDKV